MNHVLQLFAIAALASGAGAVPPADAAPHRVVSLDGGTTETLFALGAGDCLVARDSGSTYPEAAAALPSIGDGHQINVEAVLGLKPTLVIGRNRAMSGPGMHLLEQARIEVVRLPDEPGVDVAKERITMLGDILGRESRASELLYAMDADLERLIALKDKLAGGPKPRVLIVYLRPGMAMMMGEDSNAAAMVKLARGAYAIPGLTGYKDLNAEAVVAAQPDVILCYEDGLETFGGKQALLERPGIRETPAGKLQRVIAMDDVLLAGFGPRTGEAALQLFRRLYESEEALAKAGS